ncbi:MAG: MarR family transcriptional regulator [Rhodobacteraceae bacterium]|nr:MarR family transcriptional regulator [Paracoccaceae bacterium]
MTSDKSDGADPAPLHIQNFLTYRLSRVHARLSAQMVRLLANGPGVSLMQWRILAILGDNEPLTRAEVSRLSELDKGQISHCLKTMIRDGLVSTVEDQADQQPRLLRLTCKGRELYRQTAPVVVRRQEQLMASLDAREVQALNTALNKLERFAGRTRF